MTGNVNYANIAINLLMNFQISSSELSCTASDYYRWDDWAPIVYDWCYAVMTPTQVATFTSLYNNYTQIMLGKIYGGPGGPETDYYWGILRNELDWALASYYENPMAPTFLSDGLLTRWQNDLLPYFANSNPGGVFVDGSQYGRYDYGYMVMPYTTLASMGFDLLNQTNWYKEAVFALIYQTSTTPIAGKYITFPFGDDEQSYGLPAAGNTYYGDTMAMLAQEWASQPVGQYAREWINTVQPPMDPWVAAVDPGGSALPLSNLPLDYYAPGIKYLYTKNSWTARATSLFIQMSQGWRHADAGAFQIYSGDQQLAVEHTGYFDTFLDGSSSESTVAQNGILYNGIGETAGFSNSSTQVLALESESAFTYAAVDLTNTYQSTDPRSTNPNAGHTVREFIFIKPLSTLFVIDRLESSSPSVTQSFLLHTPGVPQIVDANDVTYTNGGQELFLTTLPTTASHSYSVVNEGSASEYTNIYRVQDNTSGSADNVLLHAITTGPAGSNPVSVAITGQDSNTWTITFTSATLGTATLVLNKGTFSLGGSFGYAASGTPVLSPLPSTIQSITVTSNGPVWGSSNGPSVIGPGVGSTDVLMGVLPSAADSATTNGVTTSTGTTSSASLSGGGAGISPSAPQTISSGTSQGVTQSRTLVNDKAVEDILPESLLDMLSQDLILSKHKKSPSGRGATTG